MAFTRRGKQREQQEAEINGRFARRADEQAALAKKAGKEAAGYRERLRSGTSSDPEADRHFLRQAESAEWIHQANSNDARNCVRGRTGWL